MVAGRFTCRTDREKKIQKLRVGRCWKSLLKSSFSCIGNRFNARLLHRKRKFVSFKGKMNAEFNDVDSKVFDVIETCVSPWGWPTVLATRERVSRCLRTLHANAHPGVKRPYPQMRIPSLSKCLCTCLSIGFESNRSMEMGRKLVRLNLWPLEEELPLLFWERLQNFFFLPMDEP